jgi:hypothetical protein
MVLSLTTNVSEQVMQANTPSASHKVQWRMSIFQPIFSAGSTILAGPPSSPPVLAGTRGVFFCLLFLGITIMITSFCLI